MNLSDSEWLVLNLLWTEGDLSARQVHSRLLEQTNWAYTTAKTILDRLVSKKYVSVIKDNRTNIYQPLLEQELAQGTATKSFLSKVFSGSVESLLHSFASLETVSDKDKKQILALLEDEGKGSSLSAKEAKE